MKEELRKVTWESGLEIAPVYGFASADTVVNFGLLTALAVLLAFVLDVFLTPALLALVYRRRTSAAR